MGKKKIGLLFIAAIISIISLLILLMNAQITGFGILNIQPGNNYTIFLIGLVLAFLILQMVTYSSKYSNRDDEFETNPKFTSNKDKEFHAKSKAYAGGKFAKVEEILLAESKENKTNFYIQHGLGAANDPKEKEGIYAHISSKSPIKDLLLGHGSGKGRFSLDMKKDSRGNPSIYYVDVEDNNYAKEALDLVKRIKKEIGDKGKTVLKYNVNRNVSDLPKSSAPKYALERKISEVLGDEGLTIGREIQKKAFIYEGGKRKGEVVKVEFKGIPKSSDLLSKFGSVVEIALRPIKKPLPSVTCYINTANGETYVSSIHMESPPFSAGGLITKQLEERVEDLKKDLEKETGRKIKLYDK